MSAYCDADAAREPLEIARRGDASAARWCAGVQHDGRRRFVHLADRPPTRSRRVDAADAVRAGDRAEAGDQLDERHRDAVDRRPARRARTRSRRTPASSGQSRGRLRSACTDRSGGSRHGSSRPRAVDRPAPQVRRRCVRTVATRHGDRVRPRVFDARAASCPTRGRRDDLQRRVRARAAASSRRGRRAAAVRDGASPARSSAISTSVLRDQRPAERGRPSDTDRRTAHRP